ncbi:MAG: PAS domain S-box protein, partial [Sandaracinaceae bacterium]|nr:PAS domain S-box protein [Sandaracinaceae bacterium]
EALSLLSESESRYRSLVEALSEGVVMQTADGSIVTCNRSAEAILGLSLEQMMGRTSLDPRWRAVHPDGSSFEGRDHPAMVALRSGAPQRNVPMGLHLPDGTQRWISINAEPLRRAPDEAPYAVVATFTDVTELREAQRAVEAKSEQLGHALAAARAACWDWNLRTGDLRWTEGIETVLGVAPGRLGTSWERYTQLVHAHDAERVRQALAQARTGGGSFETEHRIVDDAGRVRWVFGAGAPAREPDGKVTRMLGAVFDATATKELEARLLQAQKMQSLGRLAGGVAHDFNNLLTTILLSVELARRGESALETRLLDDIQRAAEQGSRLTRQLLGLARKQVLDLEPMRVGELVLRTRDLLDRLLGDRVVLATRCEDTGLIRADVSQLEQVILNLAVNARDAMPSGGTLTLSTRDVELGAEQAIRAGVVPGPYVSLEVEDTGTGIAPELMGHIFEPFFTTKDHGSGLGLATCYGIVTQLGGALSVDTVPGKGTRMTLYLPRSLEARAPAPAALSDAPRPGRERILVVEDDDVVRRVAVRALSRLGYQVLEAHDAREALALAAAPEHSFDLLMTDLSMPGLTGLELADRLRATRPDLRVLLASGYADDVSRPEDLRFAFI